MDRASSPPRAGRLGRVSFDLLMATLVVGGLHHIDHVLRVDHSGWPFRTDVNPFTFSLVAYPILLFALLGPERWFWPRWAGVAVGAGFTLFAHVRIESPQMQYAMWAYNRSLEPALWDIRNLCGAQSGTMGVIAVAISMTLNILLVTVTVTMLADGIRSRRPEDGAREWLSGTY